MGFASRLIEKSRHNLRFEISFLKTLLVTPYSTAERKAVEAFRDRHAGEVGVIIANGPSLNEIDFEKVKHLSIKYLYFVTWKESCFLKGG